MWRLAGKRNFGAALLYFPGSKEHNVGVRGTRERPWDGTLNEYSDCHAEGPEKKRVRGGRITKEEIYGKS